MPEGIKVNMPKNWQPLVDEKKRDEAVKNATLKYWTLSKKHDVTAIRRLFNACPEVFLNERFVKDLIDTYLDFTTFKHNHAGTQIANMQELVAEMRRLIEEKYGIKRDDGAANGGSGENKNHHRQDDFDVDKERGVHKRYPDFDRSR